MSAGIFMPAYRPGGVSFDPPGSQTYDAPGVYSFTVPNFASQLVIEAWGPGGVGRSLWSNATYVAGSATTVSGPSLTITANAGNFPPGRASTDVGLGGTASGGDVNTSGANGQTGASAGAGHGGAGGNSPNGGAGGAMSGVGTNTFNNGTTPGGGGSASGVNSASTTGNGGGGAGGYSKKTIAQGMLTPGTTVTATVGNDSSFASTNGYDPGLGGHGTVKFTWS